MSLYYTMCELHPSPFIDTERDREKYIKEFCQDIPKEWGSPEEYYSSTYNEIKASPEVEKKIMEIYNNFFNLRNSLRNLKKGDTIVIEGIGEVSR